MLKRLVYGILAPLFKLVMKGLFRLRVEGLEHVPDDGALLVARHQSYWDITLLIGAIGLRRRVRFIARRSLMRNPVFYPFIKHFTVPINRDQFGKADFRRVADALESERLVGIFPEGTTRQSAEVRLGVVRFAERTQKPFLPICLVNEGPYPPDYPFGFPRITARIGRPFSLAELKQDVADVDDMPKQERYDVLAQALMDRIDRLAAEPLSTEIPSK